MFVIDPIGAINAIIAIQNATDEQLEAGGRQVAGELETYAKLNAPWHDRTGNARRTLQGFYFRDLYGLSIGVCGNMPYSPNLELGFHKRYAILVPTVEEYSNRLIDMVRDAVVTAAAAGSGGGVSIE